MLQFDVPNVRFIYVTSSLKVQNFYGNRGSNKIRELSFYSEVKKIDEKKVYK